MKFTRGVRKVENSRPTWKDKIYCTHFQACLQGKTVKEEINDTSRWYYVFHRTQSPFPWPVSQPTWFSSQRGGSPTSQPVWSHGFFGHTLYFCAWTLASGAVSRGSDGARPGRGVRDLPVRDLRDWLRKDHVTWLRPIRLAQGRALKLLATPTQNRQMCSRSCGRM